MAVRWQIRFKTLSEHDGLVKVYDSTYSGDAIDLTPAVSPFFTSRKQTDIFQPVMPDSGYLRIIDNGIAAEQIEALHPLGALERPVEFYLDNVLKWRGYISPESFSVDWEPAPREVAFPLIGVLDALKSVNIEDNSTGLQPIAAFIKECLEATGFDWSKIVMVNQMTAIDDGDDNYDVPELRLSLSRYNFIDVNTANNKDDADWTPMVGKSYYSILEDICKYFCWVAIQDGDTLYLSTPCVFLSNYPHEVTWDALVDLADDPKSHPDGISFTSDWRPQYVFDSIIMDGVNHRKSLQAGYKKIIITTDYNTKDDVFPRIDFKGKTLQTFDDDTQEVWGDARCIVIDHKNENIDGLKAYAYTPGTTQDYHEIPWVVPTDKETFASMVAAWLVKIDSWQDGNGKINYSFTNAIRICMMGQFQQSPPYNGHTPLISIHARQIGVFLGGGALCLSCNVHSSYFKDNFLDQEDNKADQYGLSLWGPLQDNLRLMLELGGKWYNGTSWQDQQTDFPVRASNGSSYNFRTAPKAAGQIDNTKTLAMPYNGAVGYIIPIPETMQGYLTLHIARFLQPLSTNNDMVAAFLSDLRIEYYNDSTSEINDNGLRLVALGERAFASELEYPLRLSSIVDARIGHAVLWWDGNPIGTSKIFEYAGGTYEQESRQPEYWLLHALLRAYRRPAEWLVLESEYEPEMGMWSLVRDGNRLYVIAGCETEYADEHTKLTIVNYE